MFNYRLAWFTGTKQMEKALQGDEMTQLRLAHVEYGQGGNCLKGAKGVKKIPKSSAPALLVSFFYLKPFLREYHKYVYRDWVLDSGAYSAFNSGKTIDLDEYIETCLKLMEKDPTLTEIFSLDVIGGGDTGISYEESVKQTLKNTEKMWDAGIPAIPTYHIGEPEKYLIQMAEEYPKIALGGMKLLRGERRINWARQCFARVWPKKIHGFAAGDEAIMMALPFHSVDATTWELQPCAFGKWKAFGGHMSIRGSKQDLRAEIEWYLKLERKIQSRWKKELEKLDEEDDSRFSLRLAQSASTRAKQNIVKKKKKPPKRKERR